RPNRLMQGLLTGKTGTIACLVPFISSAYYDYVLQGIVEAAYQEAHHVIILQTHHKLSHTCKALQSIIEQRVDGVLVASGNSEVLPTEILMELWSHGVFPISLDNTRTGLPIDKVLTDESALTTVIAQYLVSLGHQRIAFAGPDGPTKPNRYSGIHESLRRIGLGEFFHHFPCDESAMDWDAYAKTIFQRICTHPTAPTALVAMNDFYAARLIQLAPDYGVRIPQDLSILGCGNLSMGEFTSPPLTTVEQHPLDLGRTAVELLFRRFDEGIPPADIHPETILLPSTLVKRSSCGPPRQGPWCAQQR
ncbi:MAG TPA: LacI family DNA-binding transcriptional regulator, partial [Armatimonadota bacterium]